MKITNTFDVPLPPAEAWATLMDIEGIVTCVPGAELVEVVDDRTYKGKVSVKLGPVALSFLGTAKFVEIDEAARVAVVKAQGADQKGRGGANASVRFGLTPADGGTRVVVDTDLSLSGSVAQYGRAAGMIETVAAELTSQFAANLRQRIDATRQPAAAPAADGAPAAPAKPVPPPQNKPISGFSLMWKVLCRRLAALFSGRKG